MSEARDILMRKMSASKSPGKVHRVLVGNRPAALTRCGIRTEELRVVTRCQERELCASCEQGYQKEVERRAEKGVG
jgi:hypothetical protein